KRPRVALPIGSAEAADVIASRARPEVMDTRAPRAAAAPKAAPMSIHVLRRRARRTPAAIRPAEIHDADSPNLKMKAAVAVNDCICSEGRMTTLNSSSGRAGIYSANAAHSSARASCAALTIG